MRSLTVALVCALAGPGRADEDRGAPALGGRALRAGGTAAVALGTTDVARDEVRIGELQRAVVEALRKAVDGAGGGGADVAPGTVAALVAYSTGKPLAAGPGDEPAAVGRPSLDGLRGMR